MTDIKPSTKADIPAVQEVLNATGLFPSDMLPDMMADSLGGALWLTCHHDGRAVGFSFTRGEEMAEGTWNMLALAVHPDHQGQGFGRLLVEGAEDHLRREGQRILIVDTSGTDGFAATRGFYAALGYEEEARIRDFWDPGDDKVTFRKAL